MIQIIAAAEADIPRILEIERASFSPPWTHGALLGEIYGGDSFFALATEDGVIIGFCVLRRISGEGELLRIAVDASARRRGAADLLMNAAIGYAEQSALGAIFLEVRQSNAAAIALYKKHGFKQAGIRKNYYTQPAEAAVVMKKEWP